MGLCLVKEMHDLFQHRSTICTKTWRHTQTHRSKQPSARLGVQLTNGHEGNLPSHVVSSSNYNARLSSSVAAAAASLSLLLRHSLCHL